MKKGVEEEGGGSGKKRDSNPYYVGLETEPPHACTEA